MGALLDLIVYISSRGKGQIIIHLNINISAISFN